ncbi:unnamed protein product [Lactuca virosa]|uniref:Uncharacterized protein n=1 Tax=Lactuca virosa TaxID=75947 RepID=A0AAU9N1Z6_9ASTR|nr:unnamed protein product [Lactuca virosa]
MAYNHETNKRPSKSCCEKIHEAIFGRSKRNDVQNPSMSSNDYHSTVKPHVSSTLPQSVPCEIKTSKHLVRFSSDNAENNGDSGQKTFSEDKYNSYIDGTKMKMGGSSSDVVGGGETSVSSADSFNDTVSSYIDRTKLKLIARPSVSAVGMTLKP